MKRCFLFLLTIGLLVAVPAAAVESHVGIVTQIDDTQIVVETDTGEQTIQWTGEVTRPDNLENGDAVVVRIDADEPSEVLLINEQVQVATSDIERYHAIAGTLQEVNPDHMILKTRTGQEAFVIYPEKLFPPMPEEGKRVAIIYRDTGTTTKYSQFAASEIIALDDSFNLAENNVEVSYSDIEQPEPEMAMETETQVADVSTTESDYDYEMETEESSTYEYESDRELSMPQTASHLPLIGLVGLLAALSWLALGVLRR